MAIFILRCHCTNGMKKTAMMKIKGPVPTRIGSERPFVMNRLCTEPSSYSFGDILTLEESA